MNFRLRTAKLSDLDTLKCLQNQLVTHERPFDFVIPKTGNVEYYDLKILVESDKVNFLVVEAEDKIVGCGFGEIRKDEEWSINENVGYIGLMYVKEQFRSKGVGKLIIEALLKYFKDNRISDIRLKTYEKNDRAINAYKKYGFKNFIAEMRYVHD